VQWEAVSAVSTAFAAAVVAAAALLAYFQLRSMAHARHLDAMLSAFEELGRPKMGEAREILYHLPDCTGRTFADLSPSQAAAADLVRRAYDKIGYLVHRKIVPGDYVLDMYDVTVIRCWGKLRPMIMAERTPQRHPGYMIYFEKLADQAEKYRSRKRLPPLD
jgi:hypothetical protein